MPADATTACAYGPIALGALSVEIFFRMSANVALVLTLRSATRDLYPAPHADRPAAAHAVPTRPERADRSAPPRRRPARSADLVSEVLGRLGGSGRALEFRVFDCYTRVVGETLRTRTLPERLAGTTLFVRVDQRRRSRTS